MKKIGGTTFKTTIMAIGLAAIAACASTPDENIGNDVVETEVVTPQKVEQTKPQGPVPGSQADLEQNVGNVVYFGYDQYSLSDQARATLARQAAFLKEYPEAQIRVGGNCDERGTREYNLALGARRANAAKAYLASLGVDPSRVTTISYGKERPTDPASNEAAWAKNRNATTSLVMVGS